MDDLQTARELKAAAGYLRRNGWIQHDLGDEGMPRCAVGAILSTIGASRESGAWEVTQHIGELAAATGFSWDGIGHGDAISVWNDEPGRTAEEVIDLFESTALALEVRALRDNVQELAAERLELISEVPIAVV